MLWFYLCKSSPRNRIVQTALHPAQCACSLPWPSYVANMLWLLQLACGNEKNEKLAKEERIPADKALQVNRSSDIKRIK